MLTRQTLSNERLASLHRRCIAESVNEVFAIAVTSDDESTLRSLSTDGCRYPDWTPCPDEEREAHNERYMRAWYTLISPVTAYYEWKVSSTRAYYILFENRVWIVQIWANGGLPPVLANDFQSLADQLAVDVLARDSQQEEAWSARDWLRWLLANSNVTREYVPTEELPEELELVDVEVMRILGDVHLASARAIEAVMPSQEGEARLSPVSQTSKRKPKGRKRKYNPDDDERLVMHWNACVASRGNKEAFYRQYKTTPEKLEGARKRMRASRSEAKKKAERGDK